MNKVSDQERRKIAVRLRENNDCYNPKRALWNALGIHPDIVVGTSKYDYLEHNVKKLFDRIADLIDRETCRNVSGDQNRFECSECGFEMPIWDGDGGWMAFYFCPNCGAEVVSDED
jgi:predicted RNA-binding Zn-ribbon protein involved in translation (DUF1610 family)